MNIDVLLFSKDRAMQVDATLRSLLLHCADVRQISVQVLYRASNSRYGRQYRRLKNEYTHNANIVFVEQGHFQRDVVFALAPRDLLFATRWLIRAVGSIGRFNRLGFGRLLFWRVPGQVLLLVDDCLFVRDFSLVGAARALANCPTALGYSLRLGVNTTYCYPAERSQALPAFHEVMPQVLAYRWITADGDFAYPLEVSSSLYRRDELLRLLGRMSFCNPNELESNMAANAYLFRQRRPELLCSMTSVVFSNPINKVQTVYANRAGTNNDFGSQSLAQKFDEGYRVKVERYTGFNPNACHQEVDLELLHQ